MFEQMAMQKTSAKINPRPLPVVTLDEFFRAQGRGAQKRMAAALKCSKSTLSDIAAADRAKDPRPRVYASYSLAKSMRAYMESHGFGLDIEPLLRTEDAAP